MKRKLMMIEKIRLQPLVSLSNEYILGYEVLYKKDNLSDFPSAITILKNIFENGKFNNDFCFYINMTVNDAIDPNFANNFIHALEKMNICGKNIVLELNEGTNPEFIELTKKNLTVLKNHGISIALDDFGTQYSTLTFLQEFPIDIVKIDKKFVQMAPTSPKARSLMKFAVEVSHELGCKVVAEGIETRASFEFAKKIGADFGQGFIFSAGATKSDPFVNFCEFITGFVKYPTKACCCF